MLSLSFHRKFHIFSISFLGLGEGVRKPVESFIEAIARGSASALDVPLPGAQGMEAKLVCHFSNTHSVWQVLWNIKLDKNNNRIVASILAEKLQ